MRIKWNQCPLGSKRSGCAYAFCSFLHWSEYEVFLFNVFGTHRWKGGLLVKCVCSLKDQEGYFQHWSSLLAPSPPAGAAVHHRQQLHELHPHHAWQCWQGLRRTHRVRSPIGSSWQNQLAFSLVLFLPLGSVSYQVPEDGGTVGGLRSWIAGLL